MGRAVGKAQFMQIKPATLSSDPRLGNSIAAGAPFTFLCQVKWLLGRDFQIGSTTKK